MKHFPWVEIKQFHNIRKFFQAFPDNYSERTVTYKSKCKLHGTNNSVVLLKGDVVYTQSRSTVLSVEKDNFGFAKWVEANKHLWLKNRPLDKELVIFGEFIGPGVQRGVAVSQIPNRVFAVFAALEIGTDNLIVEPKELEPLVQGVPNTYVLPWFGPTVSIAWRAEAEELKPVLSTINELVLEVEKCDPWVKQVFEIEGVGEGLVYYPSVPGIKAFGDLAFKAKGEKHQVVASKVAAQANPEVAANAEVFANLVVTNARLAQGVGETGGVEMKNIGKFLGWIAKDVEKETKAELEASNLKWNQVQKFVADKARTWFLEKVKAL